MQDNKNPPERGLLLREARTKIDELQELIGPDGKDVDSDNP